MDQLRVLLDSQFYNKHLIQFGAKEISNKEYMIKLKNGLKQKRDFLFINDFQEVISLIQSTNHKS